MTRADYILATLTETFVDRVTSVRESSDPSLEGSDHRNGFQVVVVVAAVVVAAAAVVGPSAAATLVNLLDLGLNPQAMVPKQGLIGRQGDSRDLQNRAAGGATGVMPFELGRHQHWAAAS